MCVPGQKWDLIDTMEDATNEHYSLLFVEEEGTRSSLRGVKDVIQKRGLFCSFYSDRGSHYWHTPEAGGKVDKKNLTQFGRALQQLGIGMIAGFLLKNPASITSFMLRWPDGFSCPRCGCAECWHASKGRYPCRQCKHQQSVTAGTIFHGTKKPLRLWFKALWWFSTSKSGVNASSLQALLGLGSYQTAWCWLQKLRTCTVFADRSQLSGDVEVDEFYLGGERSGQRARGADHKCKVAVAVERQGRKLGRLRLQVIPSCSSEELRVFARSHLRPGSQITTDGWTSYSRLCEEGFVHRVVNQTKAEDKSSVLPGVHLVTSLFKRVILGTFQGRFDQQYLQRYLDEYVFRFNRRTCKSIGKPFWRIAQQSVSSAPITWKQLGLPSGISGVL